MKQLSFELYNHEVLKDSIAQIRGYLGTHGVSSMLFHLYCGVEDKGWIIEVKDTLLEEFPRAEICGISSHAEISNGTLTDPVLLLSVMFFESTDIRVYFFADILNREAEHGEIVRRILDESPDIKAAEILLQREPLDSLAFLEELGKCDPDISIFGGYPMGHDIDHGSRFILTEAGIFENGLIVITYSGPDFYIDVEYTVGWESLGRSFTVTKAKKNILYKVDDFDAFELYRHYLDIENDENFIANTVEFPLLVEDGGMKMLRHAVRIEDEDALVLAGYIKEGMKVIMSYGDPTSIIKEVDRRAENLREFEPEAVLIYTCAVRKLFWNYFMNNEMAPFQKIATACGFCTGGELNRDPQTGKIMWHNITMLTIGMREKERTGREIPVARVDASRLSGQVSLVKRLTTLVKVTSAELQETVKELMEANEKLRYMATVDELTALCNRAEIERRINKALDEAVGDDSEVALIMMDVDHFKRVNDTCGHEAGDKILEGVASVLNATVRESKGEAVGRWGGEEFFMLLPNTSLEEASQKAEEIRTTVEVYPFPKVSRLTCSLGVTVAKGTEDRKAVFTRVDNALYEAKETGRNRVVIAEDRHNPRGDLS